MALQGGALSTIFQSSGEASHVVAKIFGMRDLERYDSWPFPRVAILCLHAHHPQQYLFHKRWLLSREFVSDLCVPLVAAILLVGGCLNTHDWGMWRYRVKTGCFATATLGQYHQLMQELMHESQEDFKEMLVWFGQGVCPGGLQHPFHL